MTLRRRRGLGLAAGIAAISMVAGCAPGLPNTVASGSHVRIGWDSELTSTNAASAAGATAGNLDVAALTRDGFARLTNTGLVENPSFGTAHVLEQEPFSVRYDLADVRWSDDVPIDSTDLLLAWAAGSNALAPEGVDAASLTDDDGSLVVPPGIAWFDAVTSGLESSTTQPEVDEEARAITVEYDIAVVDWRTALSVAVPAHVVGQLAFGIDDPMAAKHAVAVAIQRADPDDLARIAEAWNTGFLLSASPSEGALLSSGPYVIEHVDADGVDLAVNTLYQGETTPVYQDVSLARIGHGSELAEVQDDVDVVQLSPSDDAFEDVQDLEHLGYGSYTSGDGTLWTLTLRVDRGVFESKRARWSFLHAAPRDDMASEGAGDWQFETTSFLLIPPGSPATDQANEHSGFSEAYAGSHDPVEERIDAGVPAGTDVCVLYDTDSAFATRAFEALQREVAEVGWDVVDCGESDLDAAVDGDGWDAIITTVPIPSTPEEIAAQWGTDATASLSGNDDPERDALVAAYAASGTYVDPGDPRANPDAATDEALIAIEASIIDAAVSVPIAVQPVVTVAQPEVEGIEPRNGRVASLTSNLVNWAPAGAS